jgi:hypothetical protein
MYLSNFLRGLDLESLIKGSDICIKNVVFSTDEFIYFSNNASDFTSKEWYLPVMNFTRTLASNFSDGVVNCYEFSNSTYYFFIVRFAQQFNNDIAALLTSFLFNLLGKALTVKNILDNV